MKALSIQQPYAWLIVNAIKDIENRTWPTGVRGWVLVHTGKKIDCEGLEDYFPIRIERPDTFETGGIIGAMYILECVQFSTSAWFAGPFGFKISRAVKIPFIPLRGQLGFFDVPNDILPADLEELLK